MIQFGKGDEEKESENEEKMLIAHLKATVSNSENFVSLNGTPTMVSHHCLHLYATGINIHYTAIIGEKIKKFTTQLFQTSTYNQIHMLTLVLVELNFGKKQQQVH